MVEFVLIRLAEIRAEAAQEEYDLAHPREAALRRRLRWLRIKAKLLALWAAATPPCGAGDEQRCCMHGCAHTTACWRWRSLAGLGCLRPERWRSSCPSKVFCWSSSCAVAVEEALAQCPLEELSAAT